MRGAVLACVALILPALWGCLICWLMGRIWAATEDGHASMPQRAAEYPEYQI